VHQDQERTRFPAGTSLSNPKKPDFIIGGAPRCGTTTLADWIGKQQGVCMAPLRPEARFFLLEDQCARGQQHYIQHNWGRVDPQGLKSWRFGEKSTNYLESPEAMERIASMCPDARIIFVLRNPVIRAWSNYKHTSQQGWEPCSFMEALDREVDRDREVEPSGEYAPRWWGYFNRGLYKAHLSRWYAAGLDRISVYFYEEIFEADGGGQRMARAIQADLDLDVVTPLSGHLNKTDTRPMPRACWEVLVERYRASNEALAGLLDSPVPLAWNQQRYPW